MKYTLQTVCLIIMAFASAAKAQQTNILTLGEAFTEADRSYPGLSERRTIVEEFQFRKKEVQSRSIPQIQFQAQQSYGTYQGSGGAFFPVPGVFNVTGNSIGSETAAQATGNAFGSVLMDWKFFEFGKQRKAIESAEYQVQGAKSSYDASRLSLQIKISRLYLETTYSKSSLQLSEKNVDRLHQVLELAKSLSSAGLKPGADTSIVASAYAKALAARYESLGRYQAGKASFKEVVPLENLSFPDLSLMNPGLSDLSLDTINSTHPYLQVIDKQLSYEGAQLQVTARKALPSLSVLGGLSSRGSGIGQNGFVDRGINSGYQNMAGNYLVGVGITWNIGNAYTSSLERRRAQKTVQGVQAKLDLQRLQMNTALSAVASRITQQRKLLIQTQTAFTKASDAYELYLARYEGGLINLTELLQIQALLQEAERENLKAVQNYWNLVISQAELSGDFSLLLNYFK
ncbi:TolC family protein [Albibacterium bauzanense]|uniref:Outer membrane protein TolC n=1 Tax=Albibacterium bauzanense TaxID=653929 RepID=A0A4R1LWS2_9SPHI|nr:TolC family protein [Albibacterium bauzanense]TCK83625.1 outer membrane protein TolC [Albibacterium bauzanense]